MRRLQPALAFRGLSYLADDVVIAPPGSDKRVKGRDAYVQSYREYDAAAKTLDFVPADPQIDVLGDTAAVIYPFSITYEMSGTRPTKNAEETS